MMVIHIYYSIVTMPTNKTIQHCNIFYNRQTGCPVKEAVIVSGQCVVNANRIDWWGYTPEQVAWFHVQHLTHRSISSTRSSSYKTTISHRFSGVDTHMHAHSHTHTCTHANTRTHARAQARTHTRTHTQLCVCKQIP